MHSVGIRSAFFLAAYVTAVVAGRQTTLEDTGLATFWPAAGIAALWVLGSHTPRQLGLDGLLLVLSTVAMNAMLGVPLHVAIFFGLANLVQSLAVRLVLAHLQRVPTTGPVAADLSSLWALMRLLAASLVASLVSSPLGGAAAYLAAGNLTGMTQLTWVVRNACGTFVVVAAVQALGSCLRIRAQRGGGGSLLTGEPRPHARTEFALAVSVTTAVTLGVFAPGQALPLTFAAVAVSVWVGFRFNAAMATLHSISLGILVIAMTVAGWGPIGAVQDAEVRAVLAQLFVTSNTVIALLLSLGVAERQRLTAHVRASESRATRRAALLDAITSAMSEGLLVVTNDGRVTLSNPAAAALSSPIERGTGHVNLEQLSTPDGRPLQAIDAPHVRALRGERVPPVDLVHRDPVTGTERTLAVTTARLPDGEDLREAVVVVARDVTRERERERELQAYAGFVAHDLSAPLGAMKTWVEILDEQLDDLDVDVTTAKRSLIRIFNTADRMQELIRDLLDYAQAQSAEVHPQRIELGRLVTEIAGDLADATRAGLDRPVITHGHLDAVVADPTLTRQLVANLIGNAVKYVALGTVPHVRVHTVRDGAWVEVRVSDNGIGIPDEARGRVFDSFVRASSGSYTGTGLGLSICATTVERHGGRIYATSGPGGQGTTMVFTLPAADGSDPELPTPEAQREERTTRADPPPRRTGSATAVS